MSKKYRKNTLKRIIAIQDITLGYTEKGVTQKWVFENKIAPVYFISRRTFDGYMCVNAKKILTDFKK
jgi:hypothetical protein